jgi:hypothetical protein
MGKIQPSYNYKPEDDEEGAEDRPAFEPEDGEEEVTVQPEGEVVAAPEGEEEETPETPAAPAAGAEPPVTPAPVAPAPAAPVTSAPAATPETPAKPEDEEDEFKYLVFFKGSVNPETGKWEGEVPKDWNDLLIRVVKFLSPKVYAPKIIEEIKKMTAAEKKEVEDIDKEFDAEYDALATEGKVPKRGTKEGDEVNTQISTIGAQFGQTSMTKAYELWSKIPKDQGGGLDYKPGEKKPNPSKQVSRLVGSSQQTQAARKPKTKIPYDKLHAARSVDELVDEE